MGNRGLRGQKCSDLRVTAGTQLSWALPSLPGGCLPGSHRKKPSVYRGQVSPLKVRTSRRADGVAEGSDLNGQAPGHTVPLMGQPP